MSWCWTSCAISFLFQAGAYTTHQPVACAHCHGVGLSVYPEVLQVDQVYHHAATNQAVGLIVVTTCVMLQSNRTENRENNQSAFRLPSG
jgi:hypothetical protein